MNIGTVVDEINLRFSPSSQWPDGFVKASTSGDGGFFLRIGWGDVQFDSDGNMVGGGTDLGKLAMCGVLQAVVDMYSHLQEPLSCIGPAADRSPESPPTQSE